MAEEVTDGEISNVALFNGSLETGMRAIVVLDAAYPRSFDLAWLTWCDHLVVHTADIGGPPSLHPDIPQRTGELLVRRASCFLCVGVLPGKCDLHMFDLGAC
jgi:hypothetical protein